MAIITRKYSTEAGEERTDHVGTDIVTLERDAGFVWETKDNFLADLAGAGRTTETVKANADAIVVGATNIATEVSRAVTSEQQIGETLEQTFSRLMALAAQVNDSVNMYQLSSIHKVGVGYKVADNSAYDVSSTRVDGALDVTVKGATVTNLALAPVAYTKSPSVKLTDGVFHFLSTGDSYLTTISRPFNSTDLFAVLADVTIISGQVNLFNDLTKSFNSGVWVGTPSSVQATGSNFLDDNPASTEAYISNIRIINLTASGLAHLTAAQCAAQFPYFSGTKSVPPVEIKIIGSNLVNLQSLKVYTASVGRLNLGTDAYKKAILDNDILLMSYEGLYISGISTDMPTFNVVNDYTYSFTQVDQYRGVGFKHRVAPNTQYTAKWVCTTGTIYRTQFLAYDELGNQIITDGGNTFTRSYTTPANCAYLVVTFTMINGTNKTTITYPQLNQGATALPYVPYKEDIAMTPVPLRSVPSIADTYDIKSGQHVRNVSELQTLETAWFTKATTNSPVGFDCYNALSLYTTRSFPIGGNISNIQCIRAYSDGIPLAWKESYPCLTAINIFAWNPAGNGQFMVSIPTGTAFADTYGGKVLTVEYQLATPLITAYPPQLLTAGVHLQQAPYFYEVLITDALGQIYLDYPLGTMKRITLIEGGLSDDVPVYTAPDTTTIDFTGKADNLVAIVEYYISADYPNPRLEYYTPIKNTSTRLTSLEGSDTVAGSVLKSIKDNAENATFTPAVGSGITAVKVVDAVNEVGVKKANIAQEAWITPTLLNGWTIYNPTSYPVGYMKDNFGFVHFRGIISGGTSATIAMTLPSEYQPAYAKHCVGGTLYTSMFTAVIQPIGSFTPNGAGGTSLLSLDSITFKAGA